jgi:hypothetical protein
MTNRTIKRLQSVWGQAGLERIPSPDDVVGTMGIKPQPSKRAKSQRTARLDLRLIPDEKQRLELMAVREGVSLNELFSRMLALYEREHGRVELATPERKR